MKKWIAILLWELSCWLWGCLAYQSSQCWMQPILLIPKSYFCVMRWCSYNIKTFIVCEEKSRRIRDYTKISTASQCVGCHMERGASEAHLLRPVRPHHCLDAVQGKSAIDRQTLSRRLELCQLKSTAHNHTHTEIHKNAHACTCFKKCRALSPAPLLPWFTWNKFVRVCVTHTTHAHTHRRSACTWPGSIEFIV